MIYSGSMIFKLIDSYGFPLWMINEILREKDSHFNVKDFCLCAKKSNNYKNPERLKTLLFDNMLNHEDNEKIKILIENEINKVYN